MKLIGLTLLLAALQAQGTPLAPATRWGIIAAGRISHDFIKSLENYSITEHKVVAIASRELHRAQEYAEKFNIERAYGSYAELANATDIDVVYVGTIHPFHLPSVKLLLENGKNVLCEKPLAMNSKEVLEMIELAESKNLFLMEALWSRFLPSYEFAMEKIAEGAIGEVTHVDARFNTYLLNVPRLVEKELGGGAILDIGGYALNTMLQAFNYADPVNISAFGVLNEEGVDIAVTASLQFPGGKLGTFSLDIRGSAPIEAMFTGTQGNIRFTNPFNAVEVVILNGVEYYFPLRQDGYNWENNSGLRFEANEVRNLLLAEGTQSTRMSHAHSMQISRIEDEIRRQIGVVYDVDE